MRRCARAQRRSGERAGASHRAVSTVWGSRGCRRPGGGGSRRRTAGARECGALVRRGARVAPDGHARRAPCRTDAGACGGACGVRRSRHRSRRPGRSELDRAALQPVVRDGRYCLRTRRALHRTIRARPPPIVESDPRAARGFVDRIDLTPDRADPQRVLPIPLRRDGPMGWPRRRGCREGRRSGLVRCRAGDARARRRDDRPFGTRSDSAR